MAKARQKNQRLSRATRWKKVSFRLFSTSDIGLFGRFDKKFHLLNPGALA